MLTLEALYQKDICPNGEVVSLFILLKFLGTLLGSLLHFFIFAPSWLSILFIVLVAAYRTADIGNHLDVSFSISIFGVNFARVPPLWATLLRF